LFRRAGDVDILQLGDLGQNSRRRFAQSGKTLGLFRGHNRIKSMD
jgi:hypothetical protein